MCPVCLVSVLANCMQALGDKVGGGGGFLVFFNSVSL